MDLNENENIPLYDIDPDVQFFLNQCNAALPNCDYHLEDSFNKTLLNKSNKCMDESVIDGRTDKRSDGQFVKSFDRDARTHPYYPTS